MGIIVRRSDLDYWDYRKEASKLIPRLALLPSKDHYHQKEKGRKSNYKQFDIHQKKLVKIERLLDTENINSFLEVSLRAQSCPMPLNADVWDGLRCPFACKYCYADYFKHSLYTSFFDNGKEIGVRHCKSEVWKGQLDGLFPHRGEPTSGENSVLNAIRIGIPIRLGIRYEDFIPSEKKYGISLELLKYLAKASYPTMINTKSALVGESEYVDALSSNPAGAAVHITMISSDEELIHAIEPGAPSFKDRLIAAKNLIQAGVRVVARIEPWMLFINDEKSRVQEYIGLIKSAGIQHLTFDSYSYSAYSKGLAENFKQIGFDFERMFLLSADSQWLSSFLLGKFMKEFQKEGLNCSTFDQGNVPVNNDWICCSVGDYFKTGFNWGSGVIAIKFIQSRNGLPTRWSDFEEFVVKKGGWLSSSLKKEVQMLWNGQGNAAWPIYWGQGIVPAGQDENGIVWKFNKQDDFRSEYWRFLTYDN